MPTAASPVTTLEEVCTRLRAALPDLRARYGVTDLAVFGSFARGEQTAQSDVDVLVEMERPLGFAFIALADDLEAILGRRVDLGGPHTLKPLLRRRVLRERIAV